MHYRGIVLQTNSFWVFLKQIIAFFETPCTTINFPYKNFHLCLPDAAMNKVKTCNINPDGLSAAMQRRSRLQIPIVPMSIVFRNVGRHYPHPGYRIHARILFVSRIDCGTITSPSQMPPNKNFRIERNLLYVHRSERPEMRQPCSAFAYFSKDETRISLFTLSSDSVE